MAPRLLRYSDGRITEKHRDAAKREREYYFASNGATSVEVATYKLSDQSSRMGKFLRSSIVGSRTRKGVWEGGGVRKWTLSLEKKKNRSRFWPVCTRVCMHGRDTRPLYDQYLMDCIGRAQTLNLTFTIIAALRGGQYEYTARTVAREGLGRRSTLIL